VRIYGVALAVVLPILALPFFGISVGVESIVTRMEMTEQEIAVAHGLRWPLVALGVVLLAVGTWIGQAWRRGDARAILIRVGIGHVALYLVLLGSILPAFNPTKSYKPQGQWIREQIGGETHIGMVYPELAYRKMGGWAYESGALVERMQSADEVEQFFRHHPGAVVLVHEDSVDKIFRGDEAAWRERILRELRTGSHLYLVVGPPPTARPGAESTD
jgi:hypothetical protein